MAIVLFSFSFEEWHKSCYGPYAYLSHPSFRPAEASLLPERVPPFSPAAGVLRFLVPPRPAEEHREEEPAIRGGRGATFTLLTWTGSTADHEGLWPRLVAHIALSGCAGLPSSQAGEWTS